MKALVLILILGLTSCGALGQSTHKNDQKYWAEIAGAVN